MKTLQERFDEKYMPEPMSGCWLWTGTTNDKGYGMFWDGERQRRATHVSLQINGTPLPTGLWALHRCDNPCCVNPDHLFAGTATDNMRDMVKKGRNRNSGLCGELHGAAKLTDAQVLEIRNLWDRKIFNGTTLAKMFLISDMHVSMIVHRQTRIKPSLADQS